MSSPPRLGFGTRCAWRERVWYPALLRQRLQPTPPSDAEEAWGVARSEPKKTWVDAALRKGMTGSVNKAGSSFSLRALPVDSRGKPTRGVVRSSPRMRSEVSARIACAPVSMETSAEPPRNFVFYSLESFKAEIIYSWPLKSCQDWDLFGSLHSRSVFPARVFISKASPNLFCRILVGRWRITYHTYYFFSKNPVFYLGWEGGG